MCAQDVWDWWWELNARRIPGVDNLAPITYTEITQLLLLTRRIVAPEEINWLIQMDNAWLTAISEERRAKHDRDKE